MFIRLSERVFGWCLLVCQIDPTRTLFYWGKRLNKSSLPIRAKADKYRLMKVKEETKIVMDEVLINLSRAGLANYEISSICGFSSIRTFNTYLDSVLGLRDRFDNAREDANQKVEASLYKRALGYKNRETTYVEDKPVKVVEKEFAPDVLACIFWLKNRDPERWRDAIEHTFTLRDKMARAHSLLSERPNKGAKLLTHQGMGSSSEDEEDL